MIRRPLLGFLIAFVLSRALFAALGLRFSTEHVASIMHFVDVELLRERFAESLLYLHGQPPLMPLFMGLVFKAAGDAHGLVFEAFFLLIGAATGTTLIALLRRLAFGLGAALGAAVAFSLLPACLVYEHYFFFTYPVVFLLVLQALLLLRALERPTFGRWSAFFLVAALLVNFRNFFHLAWLVLLLPFALLCTGSRHRRTVAAAWVLPLLLGGAWYAKNLIVFGRFEASSWVGFGLARKTYHQVPLETRQEWVRDGVLDPIADAEVYGDVAQFAAVLGRPEPTGIPILDREHKSSGWTNYHHAIYQEASRRMRDEAVRLIVKHPGAYLDNVLATVRIAFRPPTEWRPVETPYRQIAWYCDPVNAALHGRLGFEGMCLLSLFTAGLLAFAAPKALRFLRRRAELGGELGAEEKVLLFAAANVAYVGLVAVLLDTNETMRHRFMTDGLLLVGILIAAREVVGRVAGRGVARGLART